MTLSDFKILLGAYGANPQRWPDDRRAAGLRFLGKNPGAQKLLSEAAALDTVLDSVEVNGSSDLLRARILKAAKTTGNTERPTRPRWQAIAAAVAAVFAVGLVSHTLSRPAPPDSTDENVWVDAANDLGVSDIYDWVHEEDGR